MNRIIVNEKYGSLTDYSAVKNCIGFDIFDVETNQENTQYGSVENGTNNVYQLNKVFKQGPDTSKQNSNYTPKQGEVFGRIDKVFFRFFGFDVSFVDVNCRSGSQSR